ncbi:MAG: trigger factor family protein, partial [Candidatus Roizmanbacteria bacterium]
MGKEYTYKVSDKDINKLKVEVKVEHKKLHEYEDKLFTDKSSKIKVPGFRPGKAPKEMVQGKIALDVLTESINMMVPDISIEIIDEEKLNPIAKLEYEFPENKDGDDSFLFNFVVYITPEVEVEDIKKIKVEWKEPEVSKNEIDDVIRNLIKSTVPAEFWDVQKEEKIKKKTNDEGTEKSEGKKEKDKDEAPEFAITDELISKIGYEEKETYETLTKKVKDS